MTEQMEVIDDDGEVIPGLYALGLNGLSGMILWSHGLHIAWAMTSGRLAGAAITSEEPQKSRLGRDVATQPTVVVDRRIVTAHATCLLG